MLKIIECVPMLNHVILTANRYEESDFNDSLIDDEQKLVGNIKEYQTVVSVGPCLHQYVYQCDYHKLYVFHTVYISPSFSYPRYM